MYEMTCQLAAMMSRRRLSGALRGLKSNHIRGPFLRAVAGSVAIPDFYSPENIGKIMTKMFRIAPPPKRG